MPQTHSSDAFRHSHSPTQDFYWISRQLTGLRVFFTLGQLRSELQRALELRGVGKESVRNEWIRRNIGQIWLPQHKERSVIFHRIMNAYDIAYRGVQGAYEADFKFTKDKSRWQQITTGLSAAWQVYARVTLRYCLKKDVSRLPTRGDELYRKWRSRMDAETLPEIDDLPQHHRPELPSHFLPPRTRNGKRRSADNQGQNASQSIAPAPHHSDAPSPPPRRRRLDSPSTDDSDSHHSFQSERPESEEYERATQLIDD